MDGWTYCSVGSMFLESFKSSSVSYLDVAVTKSHYSLEEEMSHIMLLLLFDKLRLLAIIAVDLPTLSHPVIVSAST